LANQLRALIKIAATCAMRPGAFYVAAVVKLFLSPLLIYAVRLPEAS
jgi:hypothetical protein